jgi:shikimate kinase
VTGRGAAPRHVVLIGMMGTGKTTIGRLLAERLGRPLVDSDAMIERQTGRTVREIFEADGEPAFRVLETAALVEALAAPTPLVIAAAGGVVLSAENRAVLRGADAVVVWLRAEPAVLAGRVGAADHRPLLDHDPEGSLRRLLEARAPLYAEVADVVVDASLPPATVVEAVVGAASGG